MESINFDIKKKLRKKENSTLFHVFLCKNVEKNEEIYQKVLKIIVDLKKELDTKSKSLSLHIKNMGIKDSKELKENLIRKTKQELNLITSDKHELTNYLVEIFYVERPSYNKGILFQLCGKYMAEHVKENSCGLVYIPVKNEAGDIVFLNERYSIEEVVVN